MHTLAYTVALTHLQVNHWNCASPMSNVQSYLRLSLLLQEYEKRLLAKDHDLKCSQAQLEHIRHELAEAKRIQAEGSNLLPAPEAHEGAL